MDELSKHYLKDELYNLVQSDQQIFDYLQQISMDGLWYWDLENLEHEWMSPDFWRTLGYDPAEKKHFASEWQDIIDQGDLLIARENFEKHCKDSDYPYDQIVRYKHKNGSTVWIRCRGVAIRDQNGVPIRLLGAHQNVTEHKELENKYKRNLRELDRLYADIKLSYEESENLFELAPDAILKVEEDGTIIKSNIQASNLFGYSKEELLNMKVSELMPREQKTIHDMHMHTYFKHGGLRRMGNERGKLKAKRKNGELLTVEITLNLIDTRYGKRALATIRDVTDREALIEQLKSKIEENDRLAQMTLTDALTGVYNRRYFDEALAREMSRSIRHSHQLALMLIDLDHFKAVNDNYGHEAGDYVLVRVCKLLSQLVRFCDIVCRVGGEEFAVILPNTDIDSAMALADRICFEMAEHTIVLDDSRKLNVTLSIGVTCASDKDDGVSDIFARADKALYSSKEQGRNRTTCL